jgi:nitroreductase
MTKASRAGLETGSAVTDQGGLILGRTSWQHAAEAGAAIGSGSGGTVLAPGDVDVIVRTAARAPSVHNTQPWKFRITGDSIELHADPDRMLMQIDPAGRELLISCGAALFGLRLGLRQVGCLPAVQTWPDPARPWLVARAWPDGRAAPNSVEAELIAAVPHRHTHRGPFTPGEVWPRLLAALAADAAAEGSELLLIEQPELVGELSGLVDLAAAEQQASAEITAEARDWARPPGSQARDGVHARTAPVAGKPDARRFRQRDFGQAGTDPAGADVGTGADGDADADAGEPPAATAVLTTAADTADDWLRAGQALHRLLLRAATRWVFASLQSQPLETPALREQVKALVRLAGQPQMLIQFGRANTALATPRRPQTEFRTNEKHA